jgi:hypothetical protein
MNKEFLNKLQQEMLTIGEINLITTVLWYQYKEVLKEYATENIQISSEELKELKDLPKLINDKLKVSLSKLDLDELQEDLNTYINNIIGKNITYKQDFCSQYGAITYLSDCLNNTLHIGDVIVSKDNYMVVVDGTDDNYFGRLVTDDENHSCKDIPYSLGDGSDYKLYTGYEFINNNDDLMNTYNNWLNTRN